MYPMLNYGANYYQPQNQVMPSLKGRPVSSFEEVRAASVDFDGSVFYFPDLANKRIYTKQIGMDGSAILYMYELKEIPVQPTVDTSNYITREEFDLVIKQLQETLITATPEVNKISSQPQLNNLISQF